MQLIDNIPVFGTPLQNAVEQMKRCLRPGSLLADVPTSHAVRGALMADHHLGYSVPIGGVLAYRDAISPSGVGFDIACGNKAVLLDRPASFIAPFMNEIMDEIWNKISFGVGRRNHEDIEFPEDVDQHPAWGLKAVAPLKEMARQQFGTVGSGNHYVDLFADEQDRAWCGVHFGSRGLGHKIATHYIKAAGGRDGIDVEPVVLPISSGLGEEYLMAMDLAGRYAYAGRDWVCARVAALLGVKIVDEVHNHHNYAWLEEHSGEKLWVVRKGATPAFHGQRGFVGGSMGDCSVILEGAAPSPEGALALYSTVHGAGRVMSRTEAAGKRKWIDGRPQRVTEGKVSRAMMEEWVQEKGVCLRGAGTDESPHCYKRLPEVLAAQGNTVRILHMLRPLGVAMAGADEIDPYKD